MSCLRILISLVGVFGLLGMTWLFPFIALLFQSRYEKKSGTAPGSFDILIPAHDEEASIGATIAMVKEQIADCLTSMPALKFTVRVGADNCSDRTAEIASEQGAQVTAFPFGSKWKTLRELVRTSTASWVILVDAEAKWPERMLSQIVGGEWDAEWMGVAPSFGTGIVWGIERHFKMLEGYSGGPISVHGATVFYDRELLEQTFEALTDTTWLNDDVVIPLMLRTSFTDRTIGYWTRASNPVDEIARATKMSFRETLNRRKRLVYGNLEWMSLLLPRAFVLNPIVGLLALRRTFRVYWAYWAFFCWIGLTWPARAFEIVGIAGVLVFIARPSLLAAFIASFLAPFEDLFNPTRKDVRWS